MSDIEIVLALAQNVMGWDVCSKDGLHEIGDAGAPAPLYWIEESSNPTSWQWNPLESFADAWNVIAKLQSDDWDVSLYCGKHRTSASVTCCYGPCAKHGNIEYNWHGVEDVKAESLPRAICLAALSAVGAKA